MTSLTYLTFSSHFREVDEMEARLWAELHGFTYFETSANNGLGVTDMFQVRTVPGLMVTMMIYH